MKKAVLVLSLFLATVGCGKQIEDFVKEGVKNPIQIVDPSASTGSSKAIKISPGAGIASGAQVEGKFNLTMTNRTVAGSQIEARISINQTRVE
jgi:hypothetical protein